MFEANHADLSLQHQASLSTLNFFHCILVGSDQIDFQNTVPSILLFSKEVTEVIRTLLK